MPDLLTELECGHSELLEAVHQAICFTVRARSDQRDSEDEEALRQSMVEAISDALNQARCGAPLSYNLDNIPKWARSSGSPEIGIPTPGPSAP